MDKINAKQGGEAELFAKIMAKISDEQKRIKRRTKVISAIGLVASCLLLVIGVDIAWSEASQTGVPQIFSLLFSDLPSVLAVWQQFVLLLLESLPITGLMLVSASLLIALESLKGLVISNNNSLIISN
ncbi:hypothetical protein HGA64_04500 [Candidatus Falkowbacteria bacterium]|nr:hypothetical protein [Candidatus Falkowbacteria bacterium]